jgi:hypothetical protein
MGVIARSFAVLVVLAMLTPCAHAQSFFSLQAEVAEPTESFRAIAGTGFGAKATYIHYLSAYFALTGSTGYVQWGPRTDFPPNNDFKIISVPVMIGANILLSKGIIAPFLGGSLGMTYLRTRGIASTATVYEDRSELRFSLSPHVGVGVHIAGPVGLLLNGSYNLNYTPGTPSKYFSLGVGLAVGF